VKEKTCTSSSKSSVCSANIQTYSTYAYRKKKSMLNISKTKKKTLEGQEIYLLRERERERGKNAHTQKKKRLFVIDTYRSQYIVYLF
jgi:hypothetical protein